MAEGAHGPDRPTPPPFSDNTSGSLAERLGATPPPEQSEESPAERSKARGKTLLLRITYWSGTGLGILGALVLMLAAAVISAQHENRLEEQAQPGFDAQQDITAAEQGVEELPDQDEAQRWLQQATTAGENVAEAQNTYLEHSGPLSLDDLPTHTPGLGESDECASYLDEAPNTVREYTEEELTDCAERLREEETGGLERRLSPHFADNVHDTDGFDAVGQWHSEVSTFEEDTSLADHTWSAQEANVFQQDSSIPMVWTLTDDSGQMAAWVHGTYDPVAKKFDQMVLGTAAVGDAEEDDADTDGEDEQEDADEDEGDQG